VATGRTDRLLECGSPTALWLCLERGSRAIQPQALTHQGFGTRIIERMIGQLKGNARSDWRIEGLVCEITLPP
ncbi:MAG: hypothetical protein WBV65_03795, partial [Xanthobacteraceae bacterium]